MKIRKSAYICRSSEKTVASCKLRLLWTVRDNVGVTLAGSQPRAMYGEYSIHRMFCHDRRQRAIESDRLFDVCLPHLPPLTPCRSSSTTDRWITVGIDHSTEQLWAPLSLTCHCLRIHLWL